MPHPFAQFPNRFITLATLALVTTCLQLGGQTAEEEAPLTKEEILKAYIEAQGGFNAVEAVHSLKLRGTIERKDEPEIEFSQFKRQPNLSRLNLQFREFEVTIAYNGEFVWTNNSMEPQPKRVEGQSAESFIRESYLFSHLVTFDKDKWQSIELLDPVAENDREYYQLRVPVSPNHSVTYLLDPESFLEAKTITEYTPESGDADTIKTVSFFSDYRPVGDLLLPHQVRSIDSKSKETFVSVTRVDLNPGVFRDYFSPPGPLQEPEAAAGE